MLFEELQKLTKNQCSFEEYEAVNAMYSIDDNMTKEDAARVWQCQYGAEKRRIRKDRDNLIKQIVESADLDFCKRPEKVVQAILEVEELFKSAANNSPWINSIVSKHGITWKVIQRHGSPYKYQTLFDLLIITPDKYDTVRYVGYCFLMQSYLA